jgi:hypothetical protein
VAEVAGAFGYGKLIQAFVGRQSLADEDARRGRGVGKGFPTSARVKKRGEGKKSKRKKN